MSLRLFKYLLFTTLLISIVWGQEFLKSEVTKNPSEIKKINVTFIEEKILRSHTKGVTCLAELGDNFLASGSYDSTIKIWSLEAPENPIVTLLGHTDRIETILYMKEGILASGSRDGTIRLWDNKNNFNLIQILSDHKRGVTSIVQLSNGMMLTGSDDFSIKIWDTNNNFKLIRTITAHILASISCLLELSNGFLASADKGHRIYIWELTSDYDLKILYTLEHASLVSDLVELRNGMLASSSYDGSIRIWDMNNRFSLKKKLLGKLGEVRTMVVLENRFLVSSNTWYPTNPIIIWDTEEDFNKVVTFPSTHDGYVESMLQLKNGLLATASGDFLIKLWRVDVQQDGKNCLKQLE
jgi:WD40 repeat protein